MPFVITMANDVKQARQFTFVFPFVFFFVALLVILTTISQIILKERTQIGTMKALGPIQPRNLRPLYRADLDRWWALAS
jgi:putative ABC transport system permease protein